MENYGKNHRQKLGNLGILLNFPYNIPEKENIFIFGREPFTFAEAVFKNPA